MLGECSPLGYTPSLLLSVIVKLSAWTVLVEWQSLQRCLSCPSTSTVGYVTLEAVSTLERNRAAAASQDVFIFQY